MRAAAVVQHDVEEIDIAENGGLNPLRRVATGDDRGGEQLPATVHGGAELLHQQPEMVARGTWIRILPVDVHTVEAVTVDQAHGGTTNLSLVVELPASDSNAESLPLFQPPIEMSTLTLLA